MKYLTFLISILSTSLALGGASNIGFEKTHTLKCEGNQIQTWTNINALIQEPKTEYIFKNSPVIKISDPDLIDELFSKEILVENSNSYNPAAVLSLIFQTQQAHYVNINNGINTKVNGTLLHHNSLKVTSQLDTESIRHFVEFRGKLVSENQLHLQVSTIVPEIRQCVTFKTVPHPWVPEETIEVCDQSKLISETMEVVQIDRMFEISSCNFVE